jgi:anaerobic magnesium-protoporphyrin IX monomethyl ester cyclase
MMRVLLIAMPDTVSALDAVTRIPSLGLCSIAGNLEGCEVKVVDLVFHRRGIARFVRGIVEDFRPDLVGLSAMSHQYDSACRAAALCRSARPGVKVALGGYHASLMSREIGAGKDGDRFDFIIRGEGERTFQKLVQALGSGAGDLSEIPGLSYRRDSEYRHNPDAPLVELDALKPPDRDCRVLDGAHFMGKSFDCVETSRGCTMDCRFCSIKMMYGRRVRMFRLERVIGELRRLKERGTQGVFFVDDNITLNIPRLKELCESIVSQKLNTMSYIMQASVAGMAADPELAWLLKRAGFEWVFLGIESGLSRNLASMGKEGAPGDTRRAVTRLRAAGIGVFGGFIVGNPEDTKADILATYKYALELGVDHPIVQCLTPYPMTQTRDDLLARGLVTNRDDFSRYNGFTCNVRTEHLTTRQVNRAIFRGGLGLYFNPGYLAGSRFWRYRLSLLPGLLANNIRYLGGALRGRIFPSRHTW